MRQRLFGTANDSHSEISLPVDLDSFHYNKQVIIIKRTVSNLHMLIWIFM